MEEKTMELMLQDDETSLKGELVSVADTFCSIVPKTDKEKAMLFKVMNNPDERLADHINKVIPVKDLYMEIVTIVDGATGELVKVPRIVIVDKDGKGYQCVSRGIFSALKKLVQIYGVPTWTKPINIEIKQIKKSERSILTFNVVS